MAQTSEHKPAGRPFNSPLEYGLRMLFLLHATAPKEADLQRLISYDYLLVHSNDVEKGPHSLHPAVPFRGAEWLVKRDMIRDGLDLMFSRELLDKRFTPHGITYAANKLTKAFLSLLKSKYARELGARSQWVSGRFGELSDQALGAFMSENIGRWGTEFERLTALRELEL
ncbi:MAG: hypothetical protein IPK66_17670 [Rhodospirillales bacterium]|nr:hypothetical protein [Rhodospirillales bacterium]